MSLLPLKVILLFCLVSFSMGQFDDANFITFPSCKFSKRIHWIFALDYSGSMRRNTPTRWSQLKKLVNKYAVTKFDKEGLMDEIDHTTDFVTAYLFGSKAYNSIITRYDIPNGYKLPLPNNAKPNEGTNFKKALAKAISVINKYKYENVCFVMVTDGQAKYPSS